jgi:hypothetical protein
MRSFETENRMPKRCAAAAAVVCVSLFAQVMVIQVVATQAVAAQDAPPPARQEPARQETRQEKTGVFESIGRWFDQGASNFRDHLQGAKRRMDDLNDEAAANSRGFNDKAAEVGKNAVDATRGAVDAVGKLPTARVMTGRERCIVAPNGAPDCLAAAELLCKKHGYVSGKSMDFTSAEECPAKVYLGGATTGAECQTVTFISRAMCQ